ncbi:MAG TPA: hypothetical protein VFY20_12085 [Gemmatimonadales bacterium]|nr:hypothetical protein [Gemmatimonadales bacterium]
MTGGVPMRFEEIVELLSWAGNQDRPVRVVTLERGEIIGVPTTVDTHVTAHEAWLRPLDGETEIAVSLGEIRAVELL